MSWRLHHVMLPSPDVRASAAFYADVLDMQEGRPDFKDQDRGIFPIDPDSVGWFEDGNCQLHLARATRNFAPDNGFHIDPMVNGHLAIEVEDLSEVKRRLEKLGVYYADVGNWAINGYIQLYCLDPAMNAVEVNQRV